MNGAEDKLPRLIADLVLATSPVPDAIRFLSDGAGRVRGFDGVLISPGSKPFVPQGKSYWEFGCGEDIAKKASKEVQKRTDQVEPSERAQATLVFVSPRHYNNPIKLRQKLEAELAHGRGWKEFRLYDGGELRHWLNLAPAVAARWAKLEMGAYPEDVLSIEEFWQNYSSRFERRLLEEVLLAGRQAQAAEVISRLARLKPDRIPISADAPDESVAFTVAAIRRTDPGTRLVLEARTLIVTSEKAVRGVMERNLVFIPVGAALSSAGLLLGQGPTVLPLARAGTGAGDISLPRPPRHEFIEALMPSGLSRSQAEQLAAECGRSVTVLARRRPSITASRPHWGDRLELVPAVLAGGWDSANENDIAVIAKLAGIGGDEYGNWQVAMQPLLLGEDPAIEHEGTVWKLRAPVDAFVTLGRHIGPGHFMRLRDAAHQVFSDRNANIGKSAAERFMSGPDLKHSIWLREGLATALLLTATLASAAEIAPALATYGGAQAWVDEVVGSLSGLDSDVELLASLREALPLLAEAAPRPFVAALDRMVRRTPEMVSTLFVERTEFISPESDHVWLLWALEALAWEPRMLTKVCILLARLSALDPGGKLTNRPQQSLREILLPWLPHTDAPLASRLGAMKAVIRTDANVGWDLVLQLLPEHHGVSSMTRRPKLREAGTHDSGIPRTEAADAYRYASKQALELLGSDPGRWGQLIERLPDLASEDLEAVTARLDGFFAGLPQKEREEPWRKLRALVARHSSVPKADWTLKGEPLVALSQLVDRWAPEEPVKAAALLFDDPRYGHGSYPPAAEAAQELETRSEDAIRNLLATEGHSGLLRLASATQSAWAVGRKAAEVVAGVGDGIALCAAALAADSPALTEFAIAVSAGMATRECDEWRRHLELSNERGMPPKHLAALLIGLPDTPSTWDLAEHFGYDVDNAYWTRKRHWRLDDSAELERAARKFLEVGRAMAALSLLDDATEPSTVLVFTALDQAVAEANSNAGLSDPLVTYHVERIFDALRKRTDVDRTELARREFAWFPLLAGPGRPRRDLALFDIMARDPTDFVAFLKTVFRAKSTEHEDAKASDDNRWRAAYNVLEAFRNVPGSSSAGFDGAILGAWVKLALEMLQDADIADVGAQYVGKVLAHAPVDPDDGAWPATPLRDLIEELESDHLETGIAIERFNMRGVHTKALYDGGKDERELARVNRTWAQVCAPWPRTSDLLLRIAADWDHHADREDTEARQRKMRD